MQYQWIESNVHVRIAATYITVLSDIHVRIAATCITVFTVITCLTMSNVSIMLHWMKMYWMKFMICTECYGQHSECKVLLGPEIFVARMMIGCKFGL